MWIFGISSKTRVIIWNTRVNIWNTAELEQSQRTNESLHNKLGQLSVHLSNVQHSSSQNAQQNITLKEVCSILLTSSDNAWSDNALTFYMKFLSVASEFLEVRCTIYFIVIVVDFCHETLFFFRNVSDVDCRVNTTAPLFYRWRFPLWKANWDEHILECELFAGERTPQGATAEDGRITWRLHS